MSTSLELKSGQLKAQKLTLAGAPGSTVSATLAGQSVATTAKVTDGQIEILHRGFLRLLEKAVHHAEPPLMGEKQ